jgi:hypothetical protein
LEHYFPFNLTMMNVGKLLWYALLMIPIVTHFARAQGTGANLSGYVTDASGAAPVIGAAVQAKNESTGFFTGTITDQSGRFLLKDLQLGGPYTVTISFVGYGSATRKGYRLSQGDLVELGTVRLAEGETQLNEVIVAANGFKTDKARLGNATKISGQTLNRIPTATRNYNALASLSPSARVRRGPAPRPV